MIVPHLQNLVRAVPGPAQGARERGAIDFDTTETYIVCNAQGKIEQILPRTRNDAHRLIEECMLTANVCAADFLERFKHPALYRIHAGPSEENLQEPARVPAHVGLSLGGGDKPQASDYAEVMDKIKSRPDAPMLQTMLLRSMQQAVYSPDNIGHFGLAYEAYAHFTSPIRRYPDLLVHRAIKAVLAHTKYQPAFGARHRAEHSGLAQGAPPERGRMPRRRRRTRPPAPSATKPSGMSWACTARQTSAGPTRPPAMWRPG